MKKSNGWSEDDCSESQASSFDPEEPDLTCDTIFNGRLVIRQPRQGYRFSLDALLLADFTQVRPGMTVLDLGAGVGVIGLALAWKMTRGSLIAVEVQARLARLARINFDNFPGQVRFKVLETDWTKVIDQDIGGRVDLVVSNPPYRPLGSGRINPDLEEAVARHEIRGSAAAAVQAGRRLLKTGGAMTLIYPAVRLAGLMTALKTGGLEPKRLRLIHSRLGENASLALVEARLGAGEELTVEPALYIYEKGNNYSEKAASIISGQCFGGPAVKPVVS